MFVRLLSTAALAGGFVALPARPVPSSPTTTLKYKVSIAALSTIDLSAMGAGEQKNSSGFTGYFTMTLQDTTGGKALTVLLDSMKVDSATQGMAALQAAADSSKGASWHGLLTEKGKIDNLVFVSGGPGAQQFEAVLAGFFPRGAAHTKKKGDVWTDTLSYTSTSGERVHDHQDDDHLHRGRRGDLRHRQGADDQHDEHHLVRGQPGRPGRRHADGRATARASGSTT